MSRHYIHEQRERQKRSIARLTRGGECFEVIVKPQSAFLFRLGKNLSISNVLVTETIFLDAGKGLKASEENLQEAFGTTDPREIATIILKKGTLQITGEQRRQLIEEKRNKIISLMSNVLIF